MKVKVRVEFDVEVSSVEVDNPLTEEHAVCAASLTAWHNVCLTANGQDICDSVETHVDGFGICIVKMGGDHE